MWFLCKILGTPILSTSNNNNSAQPLTHNSVPAPTPLVSTPSLQTPPIQTPPTSEIPVKPGTADPILGILLKMIRKENS